MPIITEYSLEGATSRNEFFIKPTFTKIAFLGESSKKILKSLAQLNRFCWINMYLKLAVMIPVVSKN
jgi:hypothetical protein